MNGIDISRWNKVDLAKVPCDFVIVKATQGTKYVSPEYDTQIAQAESLNKYLGIYHYAGGGGAAEEAEHFIKVVKPYIGKAILVLDWEGDQNPNFNNPVYAMAWLAYVKQKTGIVPFIYMSKSVCRQYAKQWDSSYPLWCAQYKNQQPTGYQDNPWTDSKGFGAWSDCKILQYSSKGQLPGYNGNLDLDKSYMDGDEWLRWAQGDIIPEQPSDYRPTLKKGDRGEAVRAWQMLLKEQGYNIGKSGCDGIFGNDTEKAVIKYQQDHGMESGIIGQQTWNTL
jgi:lysozyme